MTETATRQVICMKWGALYGARYVNCLYAMARRQLTGPLRFVCLTDDAEGIRDEVECLPCPQVNLPAPHHLRGWRKLTTFADSDRLFGLTGDWLFLDLDVVITGSLDDFFSHRPDEPFVVMRNWSQPGSGIGNTSVYRFRVGAMQSLLTDLLADPMPLIDRHVNSQTYVSRSLGEPCFWPDEWCLLFKVQCVPPWPQRWWRAPLLPPGARVVAFPGVPNPHQAAVGEWPAGSPLKKLYKTIRPTPWISEHWRE